MTHAYPFRALRPSDNEAARRLCSLPYDVMSAPEARDMLSGGSNQWLRVIRPDALAEDDSDAPALWAMSKQALDSFIADGLLIRDDTPSVYIYEEVFRQRSQLGIVCLCSVQDYLDGTIKVHERTFPAKVLDRANHFKAMSAQTEPVFFFHRHNPAIMDAVRAASAGEPLYDFEHDGVAQRLWKPTPEQSDAIVEALSGCECLYIADGHHRTQASAEAGADRMMAVVFDEDELAVLDYNRLIADISGMPVESFLERVKQAFELTPLDSMQAPQKPGDFSLYIAGHWYTLTARPETIAASKSEDPTSTLDCELLQRHLLDGVLGIEDPTTSPRLAFAGGIRGLEWLASEVDSGNHVAAIAVYPVSLASVRAVADSGGVMPPKSTWFEPKLRSGLFSHEY